MIILSFIVKMLVSSALLYGYYYWFLRNKKFHHYNRFFILFATVVSVVIPFIKIPVFFIHPNENFRIYQALNIIQGDYNEPGNTVAAATSFFHPVPSLQTIGLLVYTTVAFFLAFVMIRSLRFIKGLTKKYQPEPWTDLILYNTREEGTPFSFFRSIFWNENIDLNSHYGQQIFRHEVYHVQKWHTVDILFMELICIIGWFNPFFHLARKELKAIQEFLADQYAVSGNDHYDYAELLIIHTMAAQNNMQITHKFFNNHIKRRITMLTNFSNTRYNYWSRIMSLPIGIFLCCFMSLQAKSPIPIPKNALKEPLTVVIDAGHGGIDAGAISSDGIDEKQICLDISKKIQALSNEYNVKVIMTREDDILPGNSSNSIEGLKKRVSITQQAKPDLFISIHINFAPNSSERNGFDIYVPSVASENPYLEKSKIAGSILLSALQEKYHIASALNLQQSQHIFVLNRAPCPAVMVSCGYMSNTNDLKMVTSKENQEGIARKILEGVVQYGAKS